MTDHHWVAINEVVSAGLRDAVRGLQVGALTDDEIDGLSSTVTDHLRSAPVSGSLVERERHGWFWRR